MTSVFKKERAYFDLFSDDDFDTLILTTFEFDRGFVEDELLPHIVGMSKIKDVQDRLDLEDALLSKDISIISSGFLVETKTLYGYQLIAYSGIQHSKIVVLSNTKFVRFAIGSVNLTKEGFCKNREAFVVLDYSSGCEYPTALAIDILNYLQMIANQNARVKGQIAKIKDRLLKMGLKNTWQGDVKIKLLAQSKEDGKSVFKQLMNEIVHERIRYVKVISPFFEEGDGKWLKAFIDAIKKQDAGQLGIYFPSLTEASDDGIKWQMPISNDMLSTIRDNSDLIKLYPVPDDCGDGHRRPLHAKVLVLNTDRANYLMIGSSNFTKRGYGYEVSLPNAEANLLIRVSNPNERTLKSFIPSEIKPQGIDFISPIQSTSQIVEPEKLPPIIIQDAEYKDGILTILLDNPKDDFKWQILLNDKLMISSQNNLTGNTFTKNIPTDEMVTGNLFLTVKVEGFGEYLYPIYFHSPAEMLAKRYVKDIDLNSLYLYWKNKAIRPKLISQKSEDSKTHKTKLPDTPDLFILKLRRFIKLLTAIKTFLDASRIKDSDTMLKNRIYGIFGIERLFDIIKGIDDIDTNIFCHTETINVFREIQSSYQEYPRCYEIISQFITDLRQKRDSLKPPRHWEKYLQLTEQLQYEHS